MASWGCTLLENSILLERGTGNLLSLPPLLLLLTTMFSPPPGNRFTGILIHEVFHSKGAQKKLAAALRLKRLR